MIHPDTTRTFINDRVGDGVVATRFIPAGTIVWTQCDLDIVLRPEERDRLPAPLRGTVETYGFTAVDGNVVLCWDDGRYVNHSCEPAMLSVGPNIEIAVRDLQPGDELTCDYGVLNYANELGCECAAKNCRGRIRADDALDDDARFTGLIARAMATARNVRQPLAECVRDHAEWQSYLDAPADVPGRASHHFASTGAAR